MLLLKVVLTTQGHKNRLFSVLTLNKTLSEYFGILREVKGVSTLLALFSFLFPLIIFQNVIKGVQCFTDCSMLYTYILNNKAVSKKLSF